MSYREILHIGSNKSASTTLQRCLFPNADEIIYLGEDCEGYEEFRSTLNQMIYEDDWNYSSKPVNDLFDRYVSLAKEKQKPFLYSNEDIMTSRVPSQVLKRMKTLIPDATVLIIIRNQLDAIPSWYANHGAYLKGVPRRFWRRFVTADEFMDHSLMFSNYGPLDCFMYHKILTQYAEAFGRDKIKILFFEDFVKNRSVFVNQLASILEIDPQKVDTLLANKAERKRVTYRRHALHKVSRFIPMLHESKIPSLLSSKLDDFLNSGGKLTTELMGMKKWEGKLREFYKEDNRALQRDFGIDLRKHNYPL